jgi:hypothetical protein
MPASCRSISLPPSSAIAIDIRLCHGRSPMRSGREQQQQRLNPQERDSQTLLEYLSKLQSADESNFYELMERAVA